MLTPKQKNLLLFINKHLAENGVSPSFEEMRQALKLSSKSSVHRLINALEERGFIRRLSRRVRALEVARLPDDMDEITTFIGANAGFEPSVIEGELGKVVRLDHGNDYSQTFTIPVMGCVAYGSQLTAISKQVKTIVVPSEMLPFGEHFAVEVGDQSMMGAGIISGDIVVIHKTEIAAGGDIILATINNKELALRKLRCKGESLALETANDRFKTRIVSTSEITIIGKMIGLMRFC